MAVHIRQTSQGYVRLSVCARMRPKDAFLTFVPYGISKAVEWPLVSTSLAADNKARETMRKTTMRVMSTLVLTLVASMPLAVSAEGDVEAGKQKAAVCAACHGQNGVAQIPTYPNLAGQNEQYLVMALKAYKGSQRQGGQAAIMQGQAAALTDQDIANVAAYYASLPAGGK